MSRPPSYGGKRSNRVTLDPAYQLRSIGRDIEEALDPTRAPGKVRTLAEMSPEERELVLARYKKPSKP